MGQSQACDCLNCIYRVKRTRPMDLSPHLNTDKEFPEPEMLSLVLYDQIWQLTSEGGLIENITSRISCMLGRCLTAQ
jgi:hypothetical protein